MNNTILQPIRLAHIIVNYELPLLFLTTPFFIFGSPLRSITGVILGVIVVCRLLVHHHLSVRGAADVPLLIIFMLMLLSLWVTALPDITRYVFFILLFNLAIFNSVLNWADSPMRIWLVVGGLLAIAVGLCILAPFGVKWFVSRKLMFIPSTIYDAMPTILTDTIHPNIMAGALTMIFPISLSLSLWKTIPPFSSVASWIRPITTFCSFIILAIILLTKSRGAYMATAVVLVLLLLWRSHRWFWGLFVVFVLVIISMWQFGAYTIWDALMRSESIGGWDVRLELWRRAVWMLNDFPFTGIGLGMFEKVTAILYPAPHSRDLPHAHQFLLQAGVDLGIGGLLAYGAIVLISLISAWRVTRCNDNLALTCIARGCFCSIIALMTHGLVDAAQWDSKISFISWSIFGLSLALERVTHNTSQKWK